MSKHNGNCYSSLHRKAILIDVTAWMKIDIIAKGMTRKRVDGDGREIRERRIGELSEYIINMHEIVK